ncbi:MAG: hypothetical protein AB9917_22105 [Negativicutes bacterium]
MRTSSRRLIPLLTLLAMTWILFVQLAPVEAYDSEKIVLPTVSDRSRYNEPSPRVALMDKLRSQFRFPKYEIIATKALSGEPNRAALEKITDEKSADGVVVVEINKLQNRSWIVKDESFEETSLTLTLSYFNKKNGQYGQFKVNRSLTEQMSIHSGPVSVAQDAMDELLKRLDPVFPRQSSDPRY